MCSSVTVYLKTLGPGLKIPDAYRHNNVALLRGFQYVNPSRVIIGSKIIFHNILKTVSNNAQGLFRTQKLSGFITFLMSGEVT